MLAQQPLRIQGSCVVLADRQIKVLLDVFLRQVDGAQSLWLLPW